MNLFPMECAAAKANIARSLEMTYRFPRYVFRGAWNCFFFDVDHIFAVEFIDLVKALLRIEAGVCASIVKLDPVCEAGNINHSFCIYNGVTGESFQHLLGGGQPGQGWLYDFGSFACSSDRAQWCIYGERRAEIAVIGIQADLPTTPYEPIMRRIKAVPIADAIREPLCHGFSPYALSPQWRDQFLREYAQVEAR